MRIAFIGCGYAADYYLKTMVNHPDLELAGVYDRNADRQCEFARCHGVAGYSSMGAVLDDQSVELVVNVTNPRSHVEVTRAALLAGKHVYVEKPLALNMEDALEMARLASSRGRWLASAPCNLLSRTAQTLWSALRRGVIGVPLLAYAELDAGPILTMQPEKWRSASGAPWPYVDEFVTGWTVEHAAYCLSWLTAFFGPVTRAVSVSEHLARLDRLVPARMQAGPDFSLAFMTFSDGIAARLTSSLTAMPKDQSVSIFGEEGVLTVADGGHFSSPVSVARAPDGPAVDIPLIDDHAEPRCDKEFQNFDFARGIADLAGAIRGTGPSHLPLDHSLHVLELTLRISEATGGATIVPETRFSAVPPLEWAC